MKKLSGKNWAFKNRIIFQKVLSENIKTLLKIILYDETWYWQLYVGSKLTNYMLVQS
jgi:hypothetical protein